MVGIPPSSRGMGRYSISFGWESVKEGGGKRTFHLCEERSRIGTNTLMGIAWKIHWTGPSSQPFLIDVKHTANIGNCTITWNTVRLFAQFCDVRRSYIDSPCKLALIKMVMPFVGKNKWTAKDRLFAEAIVRQPIRERQKAEQAAREEARHYHFKWEREQRTLLPLFVLLTQ